MTTEKIKNLPKPAKVAATHALEDLDLRVTEIARILGIGERSVYRYLTEEVDEKWQSFGESIKKIFALKEEEVAAKALKLIEEKLPRAQFRELVGLYKTLQELKIARTAGAKGIRFEGTGKLEYLEVE